MNYLDTRGIVSQIQSFCVNDGEGIRTNIFLSGCPLRCKWCANPETWTVKPKLAVVKEKCTGCNKCVLCCPHKAALNPQNRDVFITEKCTACGLCIDPCLTSARKIMGSKMSVKELLKRVKKDMIFFRESGGGVTFSGGEPTFQKDFLKAIVNTFWDIGIDMAIETSGYFVWEEVKDTIDKLDFIFVDIKHFDSKKHFELTGVYNTRILENIKKIGNLDKKVVIRIPLIENVNTSIENIKKTAEFVKQHVRGGSIEILPYHNLGLCKYDALGLKKNKNTFNTPSEKKIQDIKELISSIGVEIADYK